MRSRKRSDSQTTTGSVVEASWEKKEKEGKKKGTWSIWGRNDSKKDRVPLTQTAQPTQTVEKLSIRYVTWATTWRMRQAVARTGRHMLFHVQRRRPDRLQPPVPHLYWLLQPCHGSPGGRSSQGVPGWFVEPTEHRHAFHSFGPNIYPNHDIFFLGLTRSSANFSVLSHVLWSAISRAVLITHVPDARYPPLALPRPLPEIIIIIILLTTSQLQPFTPHLHALRSSLLTLIVPWPIQDRHWQLRGLSLDTELHLPVDDEELDEEAEEVRKAMLESWPVLAHPCCDCPLHP